MEWAAAFALSGENAKWRSPAIDNTSGTVDPLPTDLAVDLAGQLRRPRSDPFGNGMLMVILLLEPSLVHS